MNKEQEITLLYQLIEKHFGSGVLMQFEDLTETDNDQLLNRIETMINKKEDLYGTEFAITNKEEAQALQDLCDSLGIEPGDWSGCQYTGGAMRGLVSFDIGTAHSCKLVFTSKLPDTDTMEEFKLLRKADISEILKEQKRTKESYEKLNFNHAWEAVKHIENGGSFFVKKTEGLSPFWVEISHLQGAVADWKFAHERIETPIEWWEDAAEFINQHGFAGFANGKLEAQVSMTRDQWCDFARILLEQGE